MTATEKLIDAFFDEVSRLGEHDALAAVEACRRRCESVEATLLAARVDLGTGDDRGAKQLLRSLAAPSRAERLRRLRRAKVIAERPDLADRVASGEASAEVLDVLASAQRQSDGAALADGSFVARVVSAGPDLGRQVKRRWLDDRATRADVEAEYRRQREQGTAWRHRTDAGLAAITLAGDRATIDRVWAEIGVRADDAEYRLDGGREVVGYKHRRRCQQRCFDAAVGMLGGLGVQPSELTKTGGGARRAAVVITIDAQRLLGTDLSLPLAEQIGTGPVADEVVVDSLRQADLYTLLCDPVGQPLWLGRARRAATRAQLIALIVRDRGCVATGERWQHCDAHHCVPFNAEARGATDIDNLVLLSHEAHRDTHRQHQTWKRDADGAC